MNAGRPFVLIESPRGGVLDPPAASVLQADAGSAGARGLLFQNPRDVIVCRKTAQIPAALARLDEERAAGRSVAGYVAYEAAEAWSALSDDSSTGPGPGDVSISSERISESDAAPPLLYMLVCDAPIEVSVTEFLCSRIEADADSADAAQYPGGYSFRADPVADRARVADALPAGDRDRHRFFAALDRIKAHLAAGECYQINYTQNTDFAFAGNPCALYARLRRLQPTAYSALIHFGPGEGDSESRRAILSLSPELFFEYGPALDEGSDLIVPTKPPGTADDKDYILQTRPMKGTAPRYRDPELDRASREFLARDSKTLAEHRMIVDLLRNDLGVHARLGGVDLPEMLALESHDTVHQMTSLVRARLAPDTNEKLFQKIFPALFPCGSITGAPKLAARRIIAGLEAQARGIYTGAIGYATPETARFNVAIRSLAIDASGRARYGSGCGIVWDSETDAEWEEYRLKQAFLRPALDDFALIETILFDGVRFAMMEHHLQRLRDSVDHFHIPLDFQELLDALAAFQLEHTGETLRVRLTVNRSGRIGLESERWPHPFRNLRKDLDLNSRSPGPVQEFILSSDAEVQSIRVASERVFSGDPFRRHKTTEREVYDRELHAARAAGMSDGLFLNERGEVVESTIANLLIHTPEDEWLTPAVDCGALPGVFLAALDQRYPGRVQRVRLSLEEALAAGSWYLVNSLRGAWPVRCD
ncbi:MAG: chorismate-binding protein [bacterium]|nr:chorismate-binding protein [bacterium]